MTGLLLAATLTFTPTVTATPTLEPIRSLEQSINMFGDLFDKRMEELSDAETLLFDIYCALYPPSNWEIDPEKARKVIARHMHKWNVPGFDADAKRYEKKEDAKIRSRPTQSETVVSSKKCLKVLQKFVIE